MGAHFSIQIGRVVDGVTGFIGVGGLGCTSWVSLGNEKDESTVAYNAMADAGCMAYHRFH